MPGLGLLLGPEALADALRPQLPGVEARGGGITYLRYKPQTGCLARCRFHEPEAPPFNVSALVAKRDATAKLGKFIDRDAQVRGAIYLVDRALVVHRYPADRKVHSLARLDAPPARRKLLARLCPGRKPLWDADLKDLQYKLERRFVGRL